MRGKKHVNFSDNPINSWCGLYCLLQGGGSTPGVDSILSSCTAGTSSSFSLKLGSSFAPSLAGSSIGSASTCILLPGSSTGSGLTLRRVLSFNLRMKSAPSLGPAEPPSLAFSTPQASTSGSGW
ncbi:hypothetical protein KC19_VG209100 [Ceratodon purpureus]|uniref:Uncharacterized protein n=1 Tax=Ceratodon purpureus TaxID=3225 RepID=A0A8T0HS04_CERPU|nr:hypothetical protein KC19_VG209100 [Ceratodon purpureus]